MPQFRAYGRSRAVCPYYLLDSRKSISCVCSDENAQAIMQKYKSEEEKRCYMRQHCFRDDQGGCPRAAFLRKKGL